MAILIGRPINGITINGLEYVVNENGEPIKWATEKQARLFLEARGLSEDDIEAQGILFVEEKEVIEE